MVILARVVPFEELLLHFWILGLAAATFLTLPTDLHPALEGLERHLILLCAVARRLLSRLKGMSAAASLLS